MENDLTILYDVLIDKTRRKELSWSVDQSGNSLTARVGDLLVRVGGLQIPVNAGRGNAMATAGLAKFNTPGVAIAVYDTQMQLIAHGRDGVRLPLSSLAAIANTLNATQIEDVSSPKLGQLGQLLEQLFRRNSVASKLLENLKAS